MKDVSLRETRKMKTTKCKHIQEHLQLPFLVSLIHKVTQIDDKKKKKSIFIKLDSRCLGVQNISSIGEWQRL